MPEWLWLDPQTFDWLWALPGARPLERLDTWIESQQVKERLDQSRHAKRSRNRMRKRLLDRVKQRMGGPVPEAVQTAMDRDLDRHWTPEHEVDEVGLERWVVAVVASGLRGAEAELQVSGAVAEALAKLPSVKG